MVWIVDRRKLERQACECYAYLRRHYERNPARVYPPRPALSTGGTESLLPSGAGLCRLGFAIRGGAFVTREIEQLMGGVSDLIHRPVEGELLACDGRANPLSLRTN